MTIEFTVTIEEWGAAWRLLPMLDDDETTRFGFVHLSSHSGIRRWVATDPYRAAFFDTPSTTDDFEVSLSPWIFTAGRAVASTSNEVNIAITQRRSGDYTVKVSGPGGEFVCEVPDVDPPDIGSKVLIDDRIGASTTVEAGQFYNLVVGVVGKRDKSILSDHEFNQVSVTIGEGEFTIQSNTPSVGRTWAAPPSGPCEGAISVVVDGNFLLPALRLFEPESTISVLLPRWVRDSLMLTDGTLTALVMPIEPEHTRIQKHFEATIKEVCGPLALQPDQDGDYPLQRDGVPIFARFMNDSYPYRLQVFAVLLNDIQPIPELLAELNDLNTNCSFTRIFHVDDQVLAEADLVAETLDPEELQTVMRRIHNMAVEVTPTLSAVFGGTLVENPEEARKGEYRTTVLEIETFPGTWVALNGASAARAWNFPESIFVLTGWSPQGVDLGEWAHEKANRTIANTITDIGGRFLHGHGRSPSGDHSEPSLFAWGISDADAMEIARRANQDAIFEVTATEVTLLSCDDGSRESWSRFQ